jgi:hypothetical protein
LLNFHVKVLAALIDRLVSCSDRQNPQSGGGGQTWSKRVAKRLSDVMMAPFGPS